MPTFPSKPAEIQTLLKTIAAGFKAHPEIYSSPPYSPDEIEAEANNYGLKHARCVELQAQADAAKAEERAAFESMKIKGKGSIAYAIHATHDESELNFVGWSNRSAPTPTPPPGPPTSLDSPRHGNGTVYLTWDAPSQGGRVQAYKIQQRELHSDSADSEWVLCEMAMTTEATLSNQPKSLVLEYRVIAANVQGESSPSNVVSLTM